MIFLFRILPALLLIVSVVSLSEARSLACCQVVRFAVVQQADEDDDDEEDEEVFNNNPWQLDERKLFAAKKFQLSNEYAMKIKQIDNLCGLDKKQKLKLSIACKGATEKALDKYVKGWNSYIQQFGGFQQQNADDDEVKKKKKKKKKKRKKERFVVKKVEDIDPQALQMLDESMFNMGGNQPTSKEVKLWTQTVKKVLSEEQREKFDKHMEGLKLAKRNARADSFIARMRIELALADDQVEEFDKLVRPAFVKKDYKTAWNYDSMLTLYLGAKHDKKKMKKLLSEEQYLVLHFTTKPAEGYGHLFGDNVVVRRQAVAADPVSAFFEGMLDSVADIAEGLENLVESAFTW